MAKRTLTTFATGDTYLRSSVCLTRAKSPVAITRHPEVSGNNQEYEMSELDIRDAIQWLTLLVIAGGPPGMDNPLDSPLRETGG